MAISGTSSDTATVAAHRQEVELGWGVSPKKARFLQACAETRPATMGQSRNLRIEDPVLSATSDRTAQVLAERGGVQSSLGEHRTLALRTNPAYEVRYVGGWKRGRPSGASSRSTDTASEPEESNYLNKRLMCSTADGTGDDLGNTLTEKSTGVVKAEASDSTSGEEMDVKRTSAIWETSCLFSALVRRRLRTLAFCRTRKLVELVLGYSLRNLEVSGAEHLKNSVVSYRGGYTKEERRAIESNLFSGRVLGVTATCALELGIDVGALDATLHMGFPGTFASLWQQAGRAGRSGRPSLSVVVCFENAIDQYFARNPAALFHSPPEAAVLDTNNTHVLYSHLLCAAAEVPLNYPLRWLHQRSMDGSGREVAVRDVDIWGEKYAELLQYMVESRKLVASQSDGSARMHAAAACGQATPTTPCAGDSTRPQLTALQQQLLGQTFKNAAGKAHRASQISLRMIDPVTIRVLDDSRGGAEIDSLGYSRAFYELFEGAIYMHRAMQYRVMKLDLTGAAAHCRPVRVTYFTSATNSTTVNVLKVVEHDGVLSSGLVQIVSSVYGYVKRWLGSGEVFDKVTHACCLIVDTGI
jgi:DEAD/DEAH box helicase domain-containing protein